MENCSSGDGVVNVPDDSTAHALPEEMETEATATATIDPPPAIPGTSAPTSVDVAPPVSSHDQEDVKMSGVTETPSVMDTNVEAVEVPNPAPTTEPHPTVSEIQPLATPRSKQSGIIAPDATSPPTDRGLPEFATPQKKPSSDLRNIILAAQSAQSQTLFMQGSVPPSPVVAPGALHELGDIDTPSRRRSSAVGGIAGLEELRNRLDGVGAEPDQSRFDQLIQATGLNGEENSTPVVDAFLRLDFEDGNVYYIKNPSVIFGRAEGHSASIYSHVGPDGSTIIETGPCGFGTSTSSGLTSMKREKKKRKKKKDELLDQTKSTTSESGTPALSRRSSGFGQTPRFRDPFAVSDMPEAEEPIIHLPLSNASMDSSAPLPPRKNISRRHARLFYNSTKRRFELEIMGKNGAFVNEEYVQAGTTIVVEEKGFKVQIGGISFTVIVPEILPEDDPVEEKDDVDPPKFAGGKGKMSFSFHDENGNEIKTDYSENEDLSMADHDGDPDSGGDGDGGGGGGGGESSVDVDSELSNDEDDAKDESGEDADEEDDNDDSSDDEVEPSSSPVPTQHSHPKPRKSIADIRRREKELKQDRERIKELQRQLKEKEREKAEAIRLEREEQFELAREQEKRREREKERMKEEKKKRAAEKAAERASEIQRQKEARQKEKEMQRIAKEKEREWEREKRKKQRLHPPQTVAKREEQKLILPTMSSKKPSSKPAPRPMPTHSQNPAPPALQVETRPSPTLLLPQPALSTDSTPPSPQLQQSQPQPQHPQQQKQLQHVSTAPAMIDPMLYEPVAQPMMMPPMHDNNPIHNNTQYHQPVLGKPRKEKAPPRQKKLRSPSPEIKEADLPPEVLAKPHCSYVVMIHEAIVNSAEKVLSLPQIYKAIETKYPYYKFVVSTNGWQSSVRHNLGQHKAFYKVDRAGKGWLWGVVDGVSIEKEKKGGSSKQTALAGYDMTSQNGQGMIHASNGPMTIAQATPGYQQQTLSFQGINGANGLQHQAHTPGMHGAQPIHRQTAVPQAPPPPSYMPARPQQQPIPQPQLSPCQFDAPIPTPRVSGAQQAEKPDLKALVALLAKIVAQRSARPSTDPNAAKSLEQLKGFLAQLASGKSNPGALEAVTNIVSSLKQQGSTAGKAPSSSPAPSTPQVTRTPPLQALIPQSLTPQFVSPLPCAPPATLASSTPTAMAAALPAQGQVGGKAPSNPPGKVPSVNVSNLQQHIKTMTPEERKAWTKKLLEMKAKNAAAAKAKAAAAAATAAATLVTTTPQAQSPSLGVEISSPMFPQSSTTGKAPAPTEKTPVPAENMPLGPGAGKRPAGKMPLKNAQVAEALKDTSPEVLEQYPGRVKAGQAVKRPLESSNRGGASYGNAAGGMGGSTLGDGEPPVKKVDVGAAKEQHVE